MSLAHVGQLSAKKRSDNLEHLRTQVFDLIVVGGGINGAGVARDACSRGMRVALVEADDFASGTSSRSSKLIHGGIRYLENLEFGLVFEALTERRLLFEIAPHLVHPLRFTLPLYRGGRVGMFKMGLGMWAYDALSLFEAPEMHERLESDEVLAEMPLLKAQGLLGAYVYSDAYMDDDRLVIETLRSATRMGMCAANYVSAVGAEYNGSRVCGVECVDQVTGEKFKIAGQHVVSTVGPWTDRVAPRLLKSWRPILRPSKGVHLTFSRASLPLETAVVMAAEKRIVFAIPRHEMVIVGTTDTDYPGDPAVVHTERADVDYLLRVTSQYFPGAKLTEADILSSYAGVRPLVDDHSETESKTSREHVIINDSSRITFVAGGKYTTYRKIAEQTVESVLSAFTVEDQVRFSRSATKTPLNSFITAEGYAARGLVAAALVRDFGISSTVAHALGERHGDEARSILTAAIEELGLGLCQAPDFELLWSIEACHAIRETMCLNLRDFFLRRGHLFLSHPQHGLNLLQCIGDIFQELLGLSDSEVDSQIAALREHAIQELGWKKKAPNA